MDSTKSSQTEADCPDANAQKSVPQEASAKFLDLVVGIFKDAGSQTHFTTTKHKSIVEQALIPAGLGSGARFAIEVGDLSQDLDASTRAMPTHHFDDNTLQQSLDGLAESERDLIKLVSKPHLTENDEVEILHSFGKRMHTLQDFYAHSNYVELKLKENPDLRPNQIPLMKFNDIPQGKATELHTGFYYYKNTLQNETTQFLSRPSIINHLNQLNMKIPGTDYLATTEYDKLKSFDERMNYFSNQKYSVLHFDLNKDDEKTVEGKLLNPKTGIELHEYARELAVRETRRQWTHFQSEVHKVHGQEQGDKILKEMKNLSFTNGALRSLRLSIDGLITWIS